MIIRDIKDIMMCCGENCEIKETCFRYIHHWDAYSQIRLFPESPFTMHKGKQFCPKFIDLKEVKYETNESNS